MRRDTIAEDRWRVQAWDRGVAADAPTTELLFKDEAPARSFYEGARGAFKRLQVRRAGEHRFETIAFEPRP
jgi:hypothetical protein